LFWLRESDVIEEDLVGSGLDGYSGDEYSNAWVVELKPWRSITSEGGGDPGADVGFVPDFGR
jgi:hypothetical protein